MTNELKIEKTAKIEALKAQLEPIYQAHEKRNTEINDFLTKELNEILKPVFPVGADINCQGARFYTTVESSKKESGVRYPDFGSEINVYNQYSWMRDVEKMYETFNPELTASGIRMKFQEEDTDITKIQIMNFLATEFTKHFNNTGSEYVTRMIGYFAELRKFERAASELRMQISNLEQELSNAQKAEENDAFMSSFKQDNWYESSSNPLHVHKNKYSGRGNYETFLHVKKVSEKTVTIDIYRAVDVHAGHTYAYDTKRISLEEAYTILKKKILLTESPIKKETV